MKTGRNEPCPCGSGKKYKHCCLKSNIIPFPGTESLSEKPSAQTHSKAPDSASGFFGFTSPEDFDAAMAEYTAYCEGLPDDAPIPSFNEYRGVNNQATAVMKNLQSELAGKNFDSIEEANDFMSQKVAASNSQGKEDFLGLSSDTMRKIIYEYFSDNKDLVILNNKITNEDVEDAPVIKRVLVFFEIYLQCADKSYTLPLTSTGRLKPEFCYLYYEAVTGKNRSESYIYNEDDYSALQIVTIMLNELGYLKMLKTRCRITEKGLEFMASSDTAVAYKEFFEHYLDKFNWGFIVEGLDEEPLSIMRDAALFSLYILKKKADGKKNEIDIFNYFVKAFYQDILAEADEKIIFLFFSSFRIVFFECFCAFFGLIDEDFCPEEFDPPKTKIQTVKTTALFQKLFKWKY